MVEFGRRVQLMRENILKMSQSELSEKIYTTQVLLSRLERGIGEDLRNIPEILIEARQVIDIAVIKPVCTEHRVYRRTCSRGHQMESNFPSHLKAKVQYGPNVESLTGYLHARQYFPFKRMKEFFTDVMGLPVSVGGIELHFKEAYSKGIPCHF